MVDAPYAIRKMHFIAGSPPLCGVRVSSMVDAPYAIRKMNLIADRRRCVVFLAMVDAQYAIRKMFLQDRRR